MSGMDTPVLYSYWRSSCSWRVRIALSLKEIPYLIKPVGLVNGVGEHRSPAYQAINPMEQLPTLQIDGLNLIESISIMHYLEETRPQRPLLPADPCNRAKERNFYPLVFSYLRVHERSSDLSLQSNKYAVHYTENVNIDSIHRVREICEVIASGIQPIQNLVVLQYVGEEKKKEWAQHWIQRGFKAVEKLLTASAGKYCVGDSISMADCCLIPQVYNARRFEVDLEPFPTIQRIDKELETNPAFRAAHPSSQPDCPPESAK